MREINFLVLVFFAFVTSGCATIVSGRTQNLPVSSKPSGAIVTVGQQKQLTPAVFILDKRQDYIVRIEKEGYRSVEIMLKKGLSGWIFGNIFFGLLGGPIGVAIDLSSGSSSRLFLKHCRFFSAHGHPHAKP